jgi:hypothetical protein
MENNIAFPIALEFTKGGSPKITDRDGFSIANLSNTVHKHRTPQGEFIVTACNNYQALKSENTLLKEVNEAQIFTIEKYQKENEELTTQLAKANSNKERLGKILKEHLAENREQYKIAKRL